MAILWLQEEEVHEDLQEDQEKDLLENLDEKPVEDQKDYLLEYLDEDLVEKAQAAASVFWMFLLSPLTNWTPS